MTLIGCLHYKDVTVRPIDNCSIRHLWTLNEPKIGSEQIQNRLSRCRQRVEKQIVDHFEFEKTKNLLWIRKYLVSDRLIYKSDLKRQRFLIDAVSTRGFTGFLWPIRVKKNMCFQKSYQLYVPGYNLIQYSLGYPLSISKHCNDYTYCKRTTHLSRDKNSHV